MVSDGGGGGEMGDRALAVNNGRVELGEALGATSAARREREIIVELTEILSSVGRYAKHAWPKYVDGFYF